MTDPTFNESAGMIDAQNSDGGLVSVHVVAGKEAVAINIRTSSYQVTSARMTPEQARFLARKLHRMARIVEART